MIFLFRNCKFIYHYCFDFKANENEGDSIYLFLTKDYISFEINSFLLDIKIFFSILLSLGIVFVKDETSHIQEIATSSRALTVACPSLAVGSGSDHWS